MESAPVKRRGNPYRDAEGKFCKKSEAVYIVDSEGRLKKYERANPYHNKTSRLSTVERRIIKDSTHCKQCQDNNDPNNVPVHPRCQCNVITDSVESGVADPESRFLKVIDSQSNIAIELFGDGEMPAAVLLNPETVSVMNPEDVRFADLARWLEQMQPYLQGAHFVSVVIDDDTDEAVQQVSDTLESIVSGVEDIPEALRSKKLWFALAKSVVF